MTNSAQRNHERGSASRRVVALVAAGIILGLSIVALATSEDWSGLGSTISIIQLAAALAILLAFLLGPGPSVKRVKFFNDSGSGKTLTNVTVQLTKNADGTLPHTGGTYVLPDLDPGEDTGDWRLLTVGKCKAFVFRYTRDGVSKKAVVNVLNDGNTPGSDHDIRKVKGIFREEAAGNFGVYGDVQRYLKGVQEDDHEEYFQDQAG